MAGWAAAKSINRTDSPTTDKLVTHTSPNRTKDEGRRIPHPHPHTLALDCIGGPKLVTRSYNGDNMVPLKTGDREKRGKAEKRANRS